MLSSKDIVYAYRFFLNRDPESEDVVQKLQSECSSLSDLRDRFLASPEFLGMLARPGGYKPLSWPPMSVELDIPDPLLATMIEHVEANWSLLGASEPHWSVLSDDRFRSERIAESEDDFYQSGEDFIRLFQAAAQRSQVDLGGLKRCLELGCGLGRLTLWLSREFERVVATDISPSHLMLAEQAMRSFGRENIDFLKLEDLSTLDGVESYDVAVSIIVLQHNPPPVMAVMIEKLLAGLKPGGVAYFQLSTYHLGYNFNAARYLKTLKSEGRIEMHVLPQPVLFDLVRSGDCDLLEVREDFWAGQADGVSNSLLVRKRGGAVQSRSAAGPLTRS